MSSKLGFLGFLGAFYTQTNFATPERAFSTASLIITQSCNINKYYFSARKSWHGGYSLNKGDQIFQIKIWDTVCWKGTTLTIFFFYAKRLHFNPLIRIEMIVWIFLTAIYLLIGNHMACSKFKQYSFF